MVNFVMFHAANGEIFQTGQTPCTTWRAHVGAKERVVDGKVDLSPFVGAEFGIIEAECYDPESFYVADLKLVPRPAPSD